MVQGAPSASREFQRISRRKSAFRDVSTVLRRPTLLKCNNETRSGRYTNFRYNQNSNRIFILFIVFLCYFMRDNVSCVIMYLKNNLAAYLSFMRLLFELTRKIKFYLRLRYRPGRSEIFKNYVILKLLCKVI